MKKILLTAAAILSLPIAARAESELSLTLQGGGVKYDQALAAPSDLGAEYGLRLGILPTPALGIEIGYLGSQSNVRDVVNNSSTTRLITNGAFGGGLDFNIGAFKIGGRFQYNYLLTDKLFRSANTTTGVTTGNNTNFYGVNVDLGVSFH